jgi:hypothetical protein
MVNYNFLHLQLATFGEGDDPEIVFSLREMNEFAMNSSTCRPSSGVRKNPPGSLRAKPSEKIKLSVNGAVLVSGMEWNSNLKAIFLIS